MHACTSMCVTIHCVSMHFSNSQNEGTPEDTVSTSQDEATSDTPEDEASTSSPTVVSSEDTSKYITVREEIETFMSMLSTVASDSHQHLINQWLLLSHVFVTMRCTPYLLQP